MQVHTDKCRRIRPWVGGLHLCVVTSMDSILLNERVGGNVSDVLPEIAFVGWIHLGLWRTVECFGKFLQVR